MNVLVLGSGQAEYELVKRASQSSVVRAIFAIPGSEDISCIHKAHNVAIAREDTQAIQKFVDEQQVSLCIYDATRSKGLFEQPPVAVNLPSHSSLVASHQTPLNYAQSGVSIDEGNSFVEKIKQTVRTTYRKETVTSLGGFSGAFKVPEYYRSPLLVAATDGVGTKLKVAIQLQQHQSIGIDLVAMCVNDLIVCGAEPLFFLDYYATSKLDSEQASQVVTGICEGCHIAGCSLIGGETAEMPSMYQANDYDLAGFSVGMVESDEVIDGSTIVAGDVVIGLPSSGIHSNGFSLVRAVIDRLQADLNQRIADKTLSQWLLTPTKIYVKDILRLRSHLPAKAIKGLAHITGGGLVENIPRILPTHVAVKISPTQWQIPAIFDWLQRQGNIEPNEMWRVFNMGIGMVVIVSPTHLEQTLTQLRALNATQIGVVAKRTHASPQCLIE